MGNKNSKKRQASKEKENTEALNDLQLKINKLIKPDKSKKDTLFNINNIINQKQNTFEKSNLKENLESNNILDFCLDLSSNLITKSINHETNTNFYSSILVHKFFPNDSNAENLSENNNRVIDYIYKSMQNDNKSKVLF